MPYTLASQPAPIIAAPITVTLTINSFDGRPYMALLIGVVEDVPGVDEALLWIAHYPVGTP